MRFQSKRAKIKLLCYRHFSLYCIDRNQILHYDKVKVFYVCGPNMRPANPRWRKATILAHYHSKWTDTKRLIPRLTNAPENNG